MTLLQRSKETYEQLRKDTEETAKRLNEISAKKFLAKRNKQLAIFAEAITELERNEEIDIVEFTVENSTKKQIQPKGPVTVREHRFFNNTDAIERIRTESISKAKAKWADFY